MRFLKGRVQWLVAVSAAACILDLSAGAVEVRVRDTPSGPRIFVDGKPVHPRFFFGSAANLSIVTAPSSIELVIPFVPDEDTDSGRIEIRSSPGADPLLFSKPRLVDTDTGRVVDLSSGKDERTRHFTRDKLAFEKGHKYHFRVFHRAARSRVPVEHEVSFVSASGERKTIPLPYGDTLCDTVAMAADAQVDFVTFSTDNSWGAVDWWAPPGQPRAWARIDAMCRALIAANPRVLFIPRISANAPAWMLEKDPSIRMKFDSGDTIDMSSVSARPYRKAACEEVERLARHLRETFPRNFAGLHISGQNSAEWFYMLSQTSELSGYDIHTRDAFRNWLAARGAADAATATVPSPAQRRVRRPHRRYDPVFDRRVIEFGRFRQEEMASFLSELGAAVRRGTDGKLLALFFYGYTWEVGAVKAGAAETGHFFVDWLIRNARGNIDGISAPFSYGDRKFPGSAAVMSAAETISRNGILWINEDDTRTHLEELWTFPVKLAGFVNKSPQVTRDTLLRNAAVCILRGHGDWWMDLCGRGWYREASIWDVRKALGGMDAGMLRRKKRFSPEIALAADEEGLMMNGWDSSSAVAPLLKRIGFETCGGVYGQYLVSDVIENPPDAKLLYVVCSQALTAERRQKILDAAAKKGMRVFMAEKPADVTANAIAREAAAAGVHLYAPPGQAVVCAAEGYVVVQARHGGVLELDFGRGPVSDALTGECVSQSRKARIPFRKGETRIFRISPRVP